MTRTFAAVLMTLLLAGCSGATTKASTTTTNLPPITLPPTTTTTTPGTTQECVEALGIVTALDDLWGQQAAKFDAAIERSDPDAAEHWHRDLLETFNQIDAGHSSIVQSCPAHEAGAARVARRSYRAIRGDLRAACQALNTSGLTAWQC